ncbi:putative CD36 family protein [Trypoxylus dichotomus]
MSPKEFMFGYESTLMTLGYRLLPNLTDFDKLGLIDRMYNFKGDYETVYTGNKDNARAGLKLGQSAIIVHKKAN